MFILYILQKKSYTMKYLRLFENFESQDNPSVEIPSWLEKKLEDVHTKPGQGSIFAKSIPQVVDLIKKTLNETKDIKEIATTTGTLTIQSPGIGYNLVLPIDKASSLEGAKEGVTTKVEGPNSIEVPSFETSQKINDFSSDTLTIIVRPKKDEQGQALENQYIVLSAFPGDPDIPRASEWNGKYAVIIPKK